MKINLPMRPQHHAGFTLIEVMIAVAIVAILAAVALPSYNDSVRKSKRSDAKVAMGNLVQMEERYFTNNGTYLAVAAAPAAPPSGWQNYAGSSSSARNYNIAVTASATAFTITATPDNGFTDTKCGTLSLNSSGVKTSSIGTLATCW